MSDWRAHITEEPEDSDRPSIKGTGVQVEAVLRLLSDGWEIERICTRFPGLSTDDIRACIDYAVVLLERARFHAEIRRRIAAGDSHPERGIPLEELERELLHGLPEDDE